MTRSVSLLDAALAITLAAAVGLQATAQENKNSPPAKNDSQQNSNNSPGTSSQPQTDQQNLAPQNDLPSQNSQANEGERNNSNQVQVDSKRTESNTSEQHTTNDQTQSVLKSQNRDNQTDERWGDKNTNHNANSQRSDSRGATNSDFRQDFKFGQATSRGLAISSLGHNSIFYHSGMRDGDIIISYGGRKIRSQDDFGRFVVYQPGQRVPIVVWRNGREETINIVYEQDNDIAGPSSGPNLFGAEFDPRSNEGALITRIHPGSPAHKANLMQSDVVVALNGERVPSGQDAIQMVNSLGAGHRVEVEFTRHGKVDVVLGDSRSDRKVEATNYQTTDGQPSVAVGINSDGSRRIDANRNEKSNQNDDRRDNRREGRGILPRLKN